jgi:hypothetical protein
MNNFRLLLLASLVIAILTFAAPWLLSLRAALFLAGLWGAVVLLGLVSFKRRGLWFLLSTPVALYWPFVFVVLCRDFGTLC